MHVVSTELTCKHKTKLTKKNRIHLYKLHSPFINVWHVLERFFPFQFDANRR